MKVTTGIRKAVAHSEDTIRHPDRENEAMETGTLCCPGT